MPIETVKQLRELMHFSKAQEGFAGWVRPIEEQIEQEHFDKLYWRQDVSNGRGQAFLVRWTQL